MNLKPPLWAPGINRDHPLARGLVGCWVLNEGSGLTFNQIRENHVDGTLTGGASWVAGPAGPAVRFDGDNDYIELGTITSTNPVSGYETQQLTVIAKINPVLTGDDYQRIFDKSDGGVGSNGYTLIVRTNGVLGINSQGTAVYSDASEISANEWAVVAWSYDAATSDDMLYRNGIPLSISSDNHHVAISGVSTGARIGTWNHSTGREFKGQIEFVYIYNMVLVASDIASISADPYQLIRPTDDLPLIVAATSGGGTPSGAITGTASGTSTATGALAGSGALTGTSAGVGTATGTLAGSGVLSGTAAGVATTSGVLSGGAEVALPATDTFATDHADLDGQTLSDGSNTWILENGAASSSGGVATLGVGGTIVVTGIDEADVEVSADLPSLSGTAFVVARYIAIDEYYYVAVASNGAATLYSRTPLGGNTVLDGPTAGGVVSNGNTVTLRVVGSSPATLSVFVNGGSAILSATDSDIASGSVGIRQISSSGTFDNFNAAAYSPASGAITGTAAGTSTATGALTGSGTLSGTAAGVATASGALTGTAASGAITGTAAGTSTATGVIFGSGALSGTSAGTSTATGSLGAPGEMAGTAAGTSTASGTLTGAGALVGTTAGTSTASGTLLGAGWLSGTVTAFATVSGVLLGSGALAGTAAGTSTATGFITDGVPVTHYRIELRINSSDTILSINSSDPQLHMTTEDAS